MAALNANSGLYEQRSLWRTRTAELGRYAVGLEVYFELLRWFGTTFAVMLIFYIPILIVYSLGDFAGTDANQLVKLTVGNIGSCGPWDVNCTSVDSYQYRPLTSLSTSLVSDATTGIAALDFIAMLVMLISTVYFARVKVFKISEANRARNPSTRDFSIQVSRLPRRINNHQSYAEQLAAHFQALVPGESIVEVSLMRNYDGQLPSLEHINLLKSELVKITASLNRGDYPDKEITMRMRAHEIAEELEEVKQLMSTSLERDVTGAFIIFDSFDARDRVVHLYNRGGFGCFMQSSSLRFLGHRISVTDGPEPSSVLYHHLDSTAYEKRRRRCGSGWASFAVISSIAAMMIYSFYSLSDHVQTSAARQIWVVAPFSPDSANCYQACEFRLYPDADCLNTSVLGNNLTIFDSSQTTDGAKRVVDGVGLDSSNPAALCTATGSWFPQAQCIPKPTPAGLLTTTGSGRRLAAAMRTCNVTGVWSILNSASNAGTACPSFWTNPCCASAALDQSNRALMCDASSIDPSYDRGQYSVADWLTQVCKVYQTFNSPTPMAACSASTIQMLIASGPGCASLYYQSSSRLYCECYSELTASPLAKSTINPAYTIDQYAMKTCDTYQASALGTGALSQFTAYHSTLFDALYQSCSQNMRIFRNVANMYRVSAQITFASVPTNWGGATPVLMQYLFGSSIQYTGFNLYALETARSPVSSGSNVFISRVTFTAASTDDTASSKLIDKISAALLSISKSQIASVSVGSKQMKTTQLCGPSAYTCPNVDQCIDKSLFCDGFPDCEKISTFTGVGASGSYSQIASDEFGICTHPKSPGACTWQNGLFQCGSGECILFNYWCDDVNDCADSSDEVNSLCLKRKSLKLAAAVPALTQYVGYRFGESVQPACLMYSLNAAYYSYKKVRLFSCDPSFAYHQGDITIRDPANLCRQMAVVDFSFASEYSGQYGSYNEYIRKPNVIPCTDDSVCILPRQCFSSYTGEHIPVAASGQSGYCLTPLHAALAKSEVSLDMSVCFNNIPLSIQVARSIYNAFNDTSELLQQGTYRCFCSQQLLYNTHDEFFMYPPYTNDAVKEVCKVYFERLVFNEAMGYIYAIIVVILNVLLKYSLLAFTAIERQSSSDGQQASFFAKLLPVSFINTSILFVIANGYFLNGVNGLGFGYGSYSEISKNWFKVLGSSYVLSLWLQTLFSVSSPIIHAKLKNLYTEWRYKRPVESRDLVQFGFAARAATTSALLSGCCMFSAGLPLLVLVGFIYCFLSYWADKYALLRILRTPDPVSAQFISTAAESMVVLGVFLHSLLTMWIFSNQELFPSSFINATASSYFAYYVGGSDYNNIASGSIPSQSSTLRQYWLARTAGLLRNSAMPSCILAVICLLYFTFRILTIVTGIRCCCRRDKKAGLPEGLTFRSISDQLKYDGLMNTFNISEVATI